MLSSTQREVLRLLDGGVVFTEVDSGAVRALLDAGLIRWSVQWQAYLLTPAGRAALDAAGEEPTP